MTVVEMVLAVLFVSQFLEVFRHGTIFEVFHAKFEAGAYVTPGSFLYRLVRCMFCLSVWVTGVVVLALLVRSPLALFAPAWLSTAYSSVVMLLIATGALTRAANILHDLVRPFSRTPNSKARNENSKRVG